MSTLPAVSGVGIGSKGHAGLDCPEDSAAGFQGASDVANEQSLAKEAEIGERATIGQFFAIQRKRCERHERALGHRPLDGQCVHEQSLDLRLWVARRHGEETYGRAVARACHVTGGRAPEDREEAIQAHQPSINPVRRKAAKIRSTASSADTVIVSMWISGASGAS